MPHGQNNRLLVLVESKRIGRLHLDAASHPDETQIFGRSNAEGRLHPAHLHQPSREFHRKEFLVGIMIAFAERFVQA
jgi:hypothetical protein